MGSINPVFVEYVLYTDRLIICYKGVKEPKYVHNINIFGEQLVCPFACVCFCRFRYIYTV